MSINVSGTARIPPASSVDTATPNAANPAAEPGAVGTARIEAASAASSGLDAGLKAPTPPRFPWLSRLSSELEPVAKQKPPFATLPITGDNLDQAV